MKKTILVAGATGNLGGKIVKALLARDASVCAIVRHGSSAGKISGLESLGVRVVMVDMMNAKEIATACAGASCLVSALQGLHEVIVDMQKAVLDGAILAGVPRFIPSDYSTDFTKLPAGGNRNFDLRREFHSYLDAKSISATSVFNGAFADILSYNTPLLDLKKKSVGYWGEDADWHMDFTTMDDTAAFTAAAALDASTPRYLRIAGFRVSPKELAAIAKEITGEAFQLVPMGSLDQFAEYIRQQRAADPAGEKELYPKWQSGQYMHGMFSTQHASLDNTRYADLSWTGAKEFIRRLV